MEGTYTNTQHAVCLSELASHIPLVTVLPGGELPVLPPRPRPPLRCRIPAHGDLLRDRSAHWPLHPLPGGGGGGRQAGGKSCEVRGLEAVWWEELRWGGGCLHQQVNALRPLYRTAMCHAGPLCCPWERRILMARPWSQAYPPMRQWGRRRCSEECGGDCCPWQSS